MKAWPAFHFLIVLSKSWGIICHQHEESKLDNSIVKRPMPVPIENVKKILVLYTGGTIGMVMNDENVLVPKQSVLLQKIRNDHELNNKADPLWSRVSNREENFVLPNYGYNSLPRISYRVREYRPLLDSTNMSPDNWITIARDIGSEYDNWDGFVILHGTDTLAYTASALSFMLRGTRKPIILTGSQISIFVPGSDAKNNIVSALHFAAYGDLKEVCICFANKLLRGNRAIKLSAESREAFASPNHDVLNHASMEDKLNTNYNAVQCGANPSFSYSLEKDIIILRIYPSMSAKILKYILKPPTRGVVLLTYGAGNFPNKREYADLLKEAVGRGVVIINITQCMRGTVSAVYETGEFLQQLGILPGFDMTVEAAFTKLSYVLGLPNKTLEQKKQMMKTNICGEFTE